MDSNTDCSIDLPNEERTISQLNEEFQSLIKRVNKILNQSEFDFNNGEYIYKEHCNELRRQVQLSKETQIQQIEEITEKLMNEIDEFEKESLETISKVNKEQLVNKLNKMKQENEKWNKRLDEFKVDNQMLNQLRDSLSKIAFERDNFKSLLHNKMMKFNEYKNQSFVGKLSQVSLDLINEIEIEKHFEKIAKEYVFTGNETYNRFQMEGIEYEFSEAKVLSNGDLLVSGQINNEHEDCQDAVLALFDLNKGLTLTVFCFIRGDGCVFR